MRILKKKKIDDERKSNKKFNNKVIDLENFKALKEVEIEKENKKKIICDNNNNLSLIFSIQKLFTKIKNLSNNINIKSINTHNIPKECENDKLKENHEQKRKNNILNLLFYFGFYITKNTRLSNKFLDQRLILQNIILFIENIVFIFIIKFLSHIKDRYRQMINFMEKIFFKDRLIKLFKAFTLNERKKLKNDDNKFAGKKLKKRENNIIKINNNNCITIIIIIKSIIIINLFLKAKSYIYDPILFKDSKITLKVKGTGENSISNKDFKGLNYLKEIHINSNTNNKKTYQYSFTQEDNLVELIWNDNIDNADNMFKDCKNIIEINLSNFNTSAIESMDSMFEGCSSLISLDLSNFNTSLVKNMGFMFSSCSKLTSLDLSNFDTSLVTLMDSMFSHCSLLTSLNLSNFNTSLLISTDSMFLDCINLEYINLYNFNGSILRGNMFKNMPINLVICIKGSINDKFYITLNNTNKTLYNTSYSNIINKKCFIIDCSKNWKTKQKKIMNGECVDNYNSKDLLNDILNIEKNKIEKSKEEEIKYYDNVLSNIESGFTSENFDTSNIDNGKDELIKIEKMTVTFTTSQNQKNNLNDNMTSIDLGDCENLLRKAYNISNNETIYMKKIDIDQEGTKAKKVEYDVYCKLFGKNLIKLNLTACANSKISIYMPIKLNGNVDEYNSSSGYYNDVCYTATSEDGTDITLNDRQTNFISKDKIVCQEDCAFTNYESKYSKVECSCDVKESSESFAGMSINREKLIKNFKDIKNIVNFSFLICYKKLLNIEGLIKNIGSYLLLPIILFHIIIIIIFYIKKYKKIKKKIENIIFGINNNLLSEANKKRKKSKGKRNIKIHGGGNLIELSDRKKMINSKENIKDILNKKIKNKISKKKNHGSVNRITNINNRIIYNMNKNKIKKTYINNITTNIKPKFNNKIKTKRTHLSRKKLKKIKKVMKFIDEEINLLSYNLAKVYDKRSYCNYYISLLKTKHSLIFALNRKDYNSRIIKIDLFFIKFTIDYIVNALFYNDDTMHKIYESKGEFDWETQLPLIIYSYIISTLLNTPIDYLALSNDLIISFKNSKSDINLKGRAEDLRIRLTINFILYFIISFLLLVFFWYYISIFGVIYSNTQVHLLKDTLMSFGLSLVLPFVIYLLPGFFRIPSLSDRKNNREYLYNFSKILQYF